MPEYINKQQLLEKARSIQGKPFADVLIVNEIEKADGVDVVFCSECKYKDDCSRQMVHTIRDVVLEQNVSTYNKVDFCSYGERGDNK